MCNSPIVGGRRETSLDRYLDGRDGFDLGNVSLSRRGGPLLGTRGGLPIGLALTVPRANSTTLQGLNYHLGSNRFGG